jgi:hypothetical protein
MKTIFGNLPLGSHFTFQGRSYRRIAMSMAQDDDCNVNVFIAETAVETDEPGGASTIKNPNDS